MSPVTRLAASQAMSPAMAASPAMSQVMAMSPAMAAMLAMIRVTSRMTMVAATRKAATQKRKHLVGTPAAAIPTMTESWRHCASSLVAALRQNAGCHLTRSRLTHARQHTADGPVAWANWSMRSATVSKQSPKTKPAATKTQVGWTCAASARLQRIRGLFSNANCAARTAGWQWHPCLTTPPACSQAAFMVTRAAWHSAKTCTEWGW